MKRYIRTTRNEIVDTKVIKDLIIQEYSNICTNFKHWKLKTRKGVGIWMEYTYKDPGAEIVSSGRIICYHSSIVDSSDNILDLVRTGDLVFTEKGTPLLVTEVTSDTFDQYGTFIEKKNVCSIRVLNDYGDYILVAQRNNKNKKWNVICNCKGEVNTWKQKRQKQ